MPPDAGDLRLDDPAVGQVAPAVTFSFDGETLRGIDGETIAAALAGAGRAAFGRRRDGAPRGPFCGMGVCQECLVVVDGEQGRRACMTALAAGMRIESQPYLASAAGGAAAIDARAETPALRPEILVIGGGPAGLSAARAAALCGAEVLLVDERPSLGGQYFKQLGKSLAFISGKPSDAQFAAGRALIAEVKRLGVRVLPETTVWGAFGPQEIALAGAEGQQIVGAATVILATGAYERGVPMPGWTLPGFMTTGAAQTLQRAYRVAPGRRVLIAGNGPLNFQVAADLAEGGIEVVAVVEAAARPGIGSLSALARATLASPDLMRDGFAYLRRLRRAGVEIIHGSAVIAAEGESRVAQATVARIDATGAAIPGTERRFDVDAVCAGYGFLPNNDIARALGCRNRYDTSKECLVPELDGDGMTTLAGVFVAGDGAGMGGARAAIEQGFIAGCAAARRLGKTVPASVEAELAQRRARLGKHRAFQAALWRLFRAPRLTTQLARADTLICRCESVTLQTIRDALASGASALEAVKRQTRAGMGRCQGRYCGPLIAGLAAAAGGGDLDELSFLAPRPPIKPVPIAAIAREPSP